MRFWAGVTKTPPRAFRRSRGLTRSLRESDSDDDDDDGRPQPPWEYHGRLSSLELMQLLRLTGGSGGAQGSGEESGNFRGDDVEGGKRTTGTSSSSTPANTGGGVDGVWGAPGSSRALVWERGLSGPCAGRYDTRVGVAGGRGRGPYQARSSGVCSLSSPWHVVDFVTVLTVLLLCVLGWVPFVYSTYIYRKGIVACCGEGVRRFFGCFAGCFGASSRERSRVAPGRLIM